MVLTPGAEAAYKTFLAQYVASDRGGNRGGTNKNKAKTTDGIQGPSELLSYAKDFVEGTGLAYTPVLDDEFVSKLGLPKQ